MTRVACILLLTGFAVAAATDASADACRRPAAPSGATDRKSRDCTPDERLKPYEPERVRAGRDPGFVDLGNGTEVRVGGRVRLDYDMRR